MISPGPRTDDECVPSARQRSKRLTGAQLRIAVILVALSLVAAFQVVRAAQTVVVFPDFSDKSSLQLNGSAATNNPTGQTFLRLTMGNGQSASAFLSAPISLAADASFSTNFSFQITAPTGLTDSDGVQGADGITFVVQTDAVTAGGGGGGIGYDGL